jgi:autotransporter-associated beta strand protein
VVVPGSADIARWDSTLATAANATAALGADTTWGGIQIVNPAAAVTISAGNTLTLTGVANAAAVNVGIDMSAATQNLTLASGVTIGAAQTWSVASGRTLTVSGALASGGNVVTVSGAGNTTITGVISGAGGGITKTGTGTLTLNQTETITIPTVKVSAGQLTLDETAMSTTQVLPTSTVVNLAGGILALNTAPSNITTLKVTTLGTLNIQPGASNVVMTRGSSSRQVFTFSNFARAVGGTADFTGNDGSLNARARLSTAANVNGVVPWATFGSNTWLVAAGTGLDSSGYAAFTASTTTTLGTATQNSNVVSDVALVGPATTINTIRFNDTANSRTISTTGSLTVTAGGLLVTNTVANHTSRIQGGTLAGAAGGDLIIIQNNSNNGTNAYLRIDSSIIDNTSATALTKSGIGRLLLGGDNPFSGGVQLNGGTIELLNANALNATGVNAVSFGNSSSATGTLHLGGFSPTIASLSSAAVNAGTPIVENGNATAATLTVSGANSSTFNGILQDGSGGGALNLAKAGSGTLTLGGANTFTGTTIVNDGTLLIKGSITNSAAIAVNNPGILDVTTGGLTLVSGNTVSGTGSVLGTVTVPSGANLTPGSLGTIGTLTLGTLSLSTGSNLNFDLSGTSGSSDVLTVTGALSLALSGINVNLAGAGAGITGNSYTLFNFGSQTGFAASDFSIASGGLGGLTYTFANVGNTITLTIGGALAATSTWNLTGGGSWAAPSTNWTPNTVPANPGDTANFGSSIAGASTVTLDGSKSVGVLTLNSPQVYTLATGTGGNLIFDNGAGVASLTDSSVPANAALPGQVIATNVTLNSTTAVAVSGGETLAITGAIDGVGGLTKAGAGTLNLASANTYAGPTTLNLGTLNFVSGAVSSTAFTFGGGTLQYATGNSQDLSSGRTVTFAGTATIDTNGNDVVFGSAVGNGGAGGLNKKGSGKLTLAAGNTFSGNIIVSAGTLAIADDSSLGAIPGAPATNLTIAGGATLQFAASATLNANRSMVLNSGTAVIDTNGNNATIAGALSGNGLLNKIGAGTLTLSGATNSTTATGGAIIDAGTIALTNTQVNLPSGTLTLNGTAGIALSAAATSSFNPVVNGTANFITSSNNGVIQQLNVLTGGGTLTFGGGFVNDYTGSFAAFTGTLIASGGASRWNGSTGGTNLTLDLGVTATSVRTAATGITLGAIAGQTAANISGGSNGQTQAVTYTIGGKTVGGLGVTPVDSTYAGTITNGGSTSVSVTKVGASRLTLTNSSSYTGVTTISAGTLQLGDGTTGHDGALTASSGIVNNAALVYNLFNGGTYGGVISGTGTVTVLGTGTQILTGANTYSGTTTMSGGTLQLGDGTAGRDGTITNSLSVVNNAALVYNRFAAATYGGVISGTGTVTLRGTGMQSLTNANTYSGVTTITGGILSTGAAGALVECAAVSEEYGVCGGRA